MEDTESIATVRVGHVITEFSNFGIFRANVGVVRRSHGSKLSIVPVPIAIRTSSMIVSELVIGMSDPERSWSLIGVDKGEGGFSLHDQISVNEALGLSSIFNEDSVSHGVESHISDDTEVVNSMDSDGTVVSLVDGIASHVRLVDSSNHVEMKRVASQFEGLTYISEFYILNSANAGFISRRVKHDMSTVLVLGRSLGISSVHNVTC